MIFRLFLLNQVVQVHKYSCCDTFLLLMSGEKIENLNYAGKEHAQSLFFREKSQA